MLAVYLLHCHIIRMKRIKELALQRKSTRILLLFIDFLLNLQLSIDSIGRIVDLYQFTFKAFYLYDSVF
jgi:hypothetical protein